MASERRHNAPLDGLRFFAFLLVFLHHAFRSHYLEPVPVVRYGRLGVQIFFVLSGFLIGRILLELRGREDLSLKTKLGRFYVRRALRIFPVYYLVIAALAILQTTEVLPQLKLWLGWDALYLTNVRMFMTSTSGSDIHFWSLCVEEHFYFIAPLAVLLLDRKTLSMTLLAIMIILPIVQGWISAAHIGGVIWPLSFMHFDTLGAGIVAAIVEVDGKFLGIDEKRFMTIGKIAAVLFACLSVHMWWVHHPTLLSRVAQVALIPLLAISCSAMVLNLWRAERVGWLARFLGFSPFVYLGRISYGLYLFHLFVIEYIEAFDPDPKIRYAALAFAITVVIASLSWRFFEKPINDLKSRFAGQKDHGGAPLPHAAHE